MTYFSIVAQERGGPDCLQIVQNTLHLPGRGEVLVKILAASVSYPDIEARYGYSPFPPRFPFIPGYSLIGEVEEAGEGVPQELVGERVAAMPAYGGYSEYIYLKEKQLIPVPKTIDPITAVPLILNYLVAYQAMHRSARVQEGQKVLVIGASGGIGTAFLDLGKLAGLKMYGMASKSKHLTLEHYGAVPIDYHKQDFVEFIRQAEPQGLDAIFDGRAGDCMLRGLPLLRIGGVWVGYGNPQQFSKMMQLLGRVILSNLLPNGKTVKLYGTGAHHFNRKPFLEDWAALFRFLEEGKIQPVIAGKFPILQAAEANRLLESGQVTGNLVLARPELL